MDNFKKRLTPPLFGSKWLQKGRQSFYQLLRTCFYYMANKMNLVEKIAATIGCTKADAERAIEAVIDEITSLLKKGEEISVAGLGIFEAKTRAGRTGRNPRTGATIQIKSMRVPKFRASKTLKDALK